MNRILSNLWDEPGLADPIYSWVVAAAILIGAVGTVVLDPSGAPLIPAWLLKMMWALLGVVSFGGLGIILGLLVITRLSRAK